MTKEQMDKIAKTIPMKNPTEYMRWIFKDLVTGAVYFDSKKIKYNQTYVYNEVLLPDSEHHTMRRILTAMFFDKKSKKLRGMVKALIGVKNNREFRRHKTTTWGVLIIDAWRSVGDDKFDKVKSDVSWEPIAVEL